MDIANSVWAIFNFKSLKISIIFEEKKHEQTRKKSVSLQVNPKPKKLITEKYKNISQQILMPNKPWKFDHDPSSIAEVIRKRKIGDAYLWHPVLYS